MNDEQSKATYRNSKMTPDVGDEFRHPSEDYVMYVRRVIANGEYIENAGWPLARWKTSECELVRSYGDESGTISHECRRIAGLPVDV